MSTINSWLKNLSIKSLNAMQEVAIEAVAEGKNDVVVLSPTGTGKTLAYLLPLAELLKADSEALQAVVIVPGRELALQSCNVLNSLKTGLRSQACYGGRATMDEHRQLRDNKPHIIFATPGRLLDHIEKENISTNTIRFVVIDEFDKCLEMGFQTEMAALMRYFPHKTIRRILLSATDSDVIPRFVGAEHCQYVDFLKDNSVRERIHHYFYKSKSRDKLDTLKQLLLSIGQDSSIVFLNHRDAVERVASYLRENGFIVSAFHGGYDQKQREEAIYLFSNHSTTVLVGTDIASRGLDIPEVKYVIHYHLPETKTNFLHRIGRTARWDATGQSIFLLSHDEMDVSEKTIKEWIGKDMMSEFQIGEVSESPPHPKMNTIYIGKGKKDKISKGDILGFLCKKGGAEMNDVGQIDVYERYSYAAVSATISSSLIPKLVNEKIKGLKTIVTLKKAENFSNKV